MNLTAQDILFLQHRVAYLRDEQAYKKIFIYFHPRLYRFIFKITQNEVVADELVSDVLMKVWSIGNNLSQIDKLAPYLFTAARNAALTYLSRKMPSDVALDDHIENSHQDNAVNPENKLIGSEIDHQIEKAILSLPPKCQIVFRLIREEGYSHKDVSAILEVSLNTVETQMRIALKKVRLALDAYLSASKK